MVCSLPCLTTRTGYHHLGRISQKSVNAWERFSVSCGIRITLLTPLSTGLSPRESQWASLLDQDAAVTFKRQLRDLSSKVPVFTRRKLKQDLSPREPKSNIVTQQCVAYLFQRVLCYASYVGYPKGHLHTRVEGYRQKASSIYKHYYKGHTTAVPNNFLERNAWDKFDGLVNEMMCIQELNPALNVESDSLCAKVFM